MTFVIDTVYLNESNILYTWLLNGAEDGRDQYEKVGILFIVSISVIAVAKTD